MKYYSEELNKLFDTEDELLEAEFQTKRAKEEAEAAEKVRAAEKQKRYDEVKEALEAVTKAKTAYDKLWHEYTRDYGAITLRTSQVSPFWFSF